MDIQKKKCKKCGNEFWDNTSNKNKEYCSLKCRSKSYKYSKNRKCVNCRKLISNYKNRCRSCAGKNRGVEPPNKIKIGKSELYYLYNKEHLSTKEIGKILSCSDVTVGSYIKNYKIQFVPYLMKCQVCNKEFLINNVHQRNKKNCSKVCDDKFGYRKFINKRKLHGRMYFQKKKSEIMEWKKKKRETNPYYNITYRLGNSVRKVMGIYTKTGKIQDSSKYGINYKKIIEHLKPFPKDISRYHIDHIRPLCSFRFINKDGSTNMEEIKKAFVPENHQWLTVEENLKKGGRWNGN